MCKLSSSLMVRGILSSVTMFDLLLHGWIGPSSNK
ncbi:hypothetical protein A2U01_0088919, partial [Trifolium medium]|nr:hypothetical protein [Trifolium medium]